MARALGALVRGVHEEDQEREGDAGDKVREAEDEGEQEWHGEVQIDHGIAMPLMAWSRERGQAGQGHVQEVQGSVRDQSGEQVWPQSLLTIVFLVWAGLCSPCVRPNGRKRLNFEIGQNIL